jgi:hypothetical protein
VNDIAELTLKVNSLEAKLAKLDLDKLTESGKAAGAMAELLEIGFKKLVEVLGPIAMGAAFLATIKHSIELQSSFARLAEVAGTTASKMSGFDIPARLAGTSLDTVASSVARLSKAIGEARLGDVQQRGLLEALGININDGRDAADVLLDVAKSLTSMRDQNVAAATSVPLLGRQFSELRPFLKDLIEQGGIHARVTDEQAAEMKELEDRMILLKVRAEELGLQLTRGLIPAFEGSITALEDTKDNMSGLKEVGEAFGTVLKIITSLALAAWDIVHNLGVAIGSLVAAAVSAAKFDFREAAQIIKDSSIDMEKHTEDTNRRIDKLWVDTAESVTSSAKKIAGAGSEGPGTGGGTGAEARVRQLMNDRKHFEERMNILKGFGQQYAEEIKTQNTLLEETYKEAGVQNLATQTALLRAQADNNRLNLEQQKVYLQQQKDLAMKQGDFGKAADAISGIAQINSQIVANEAITQAQIRTLRAQTQRDLQDQYGTVAEIENRAYDLRLKALDAYLNEYGDKVKNAGKMREKLEAQHHANLGEVQGQGVVQRIQFEESSLSGQAEFLTSFFTSATATAATHNKKMFELNKLAGEAQIIVSTTIGVMKAWEMGPILGPIMAAVVAAAGAINLRALRATQFGGGGGIAPSTSSAAGGATPVFPVNQQTGSGQSPNIQVVVHVDGNMVGNDEFAGEMLDRIKEAVDNQDFELVGRNSRNADMIRSTV